MLQFEVVCVAKVNRCLGEECWNLCPVKKQTNKVVIDVEGLQAVKGVTLHKGLSMVEDQPHGQQKQK